MTSFAVEEFGRQKVKFLCHADAKLPKSSQEPQLDLICNLGYGNASKKPSIKASLTHASIQVEPRWPTETTAPVSAHLKNLEL